MVSVGISIWSARYATGTLMTALNVTYAVPEGRGLVLFNAVALSLTVALIVLAGGAVILIAVLPSYSATCQYRLARRLLRCGYDGRCSWA